MTKGMNAWVTQPSKKFCLGCTLERGEGMGNGEKDVPDRRNSMCEDLRKRRSTAHFKNYKMYGQDKKRVGPGA